MKKNMLFNAIALLALLFSSVIYASPAQAKTCTSYPSFTSTYNDHNPKGSSDKPILYIWGLPNDSPDGIKISYTDLNNNIIKVDINEKIFGSIDKGIALVVQNRISGKNGEWRGYYIATNWYLTHLEWDDDWRWSVQVCN